MAPQWINSKTCVKRPLSKWLKIVFPDQSLLNAGQKYCRILQGEHSAILSTFIILPFVITIFVLSIFEWPYYTDFTVHKTKSKWVWSGNTTSTHCRPTQGTVRKNYRTFKIRRMKGRNHYGEITNSLLPSEIIVKPKGIQRTTPQTRTEYKASMHNERIHKQCTNNSRFTDLIETADTSTRGD